MGISGINNHYDNRSTNNYRTRSNSIKEEGDVKNPDSGVEKDQTNPSSKEGTSIKMYPHEVMINGLVMSVDPKGEIANRTYFEEFAKQVKETNTIIQNYYAEAHKENLSFDIPYNHIVAKYKFPDSPYYRADMSEEEREMAFYQERALLFGGGFQLNDPYALAGTGKDGNFDQAIDKAVQEKLNQKREGFLEKAGGESTYEASLQKMLEMLDAALAEGKVHLIDKIV